MTVVMKDYQVALFSRINLGLQTLSGLILTGKINLNNSSVSVQLVEVKLQLLREDTKESVEMQNAQVAQVNLQFMLKLIL